MSKELKLEIGFEDLRDVCHSRIFNFLLPTLGHQLRAPLNGMIINLELLRELLKPELPIDEELLGRRDRSVAALGRTVAQLRASIDSLLAESGLNGKETGAFDLAEMVNESVAVLRPQAVVQRVTLQSEVPSTPEPVSGKRAHLRQAVLAVAVNALESMPSGGEMNVGLERSSSKWIVSIADHGPGISGDIAAKLFKMPFSTKPNRSGVGLFVARRIAEAHGGALDLDSTTGGGTRARLSVPADEER